MEHAKINKRYWLRDEQMLRPLKEYSGCIPPKFSESVTVGSCKLQFFQQVKDGGVGEWLKPAVLKTVRPQKGLVGSNPTPSASLRALFCVS